MLCSRRSRRASVVYLPRYCRNVYIDEHIYWLQELGNFIARYTVYRGAPMRGSRAPEEILQMRGDKHRCWIQPLTMTSMMITVCGARWAASKLLASCKSRTPTVYGTRSRAAVITSRRAAETEATSSRQAASRRLPCHHHRYSHAVFIAAPSVNKPKRPRDTAFRDLCSCSRFYVHSFSNQR